MPQISAVCDSGKQFYVYGEEIHGKLQRASLGSKSGVLSWHKIKSLRICFMLSYVGTKK